MIKPRIYAYLLAILMVALIWRVASVDAKGEFYREVPHWFTRDALCLHHYEGSWQDPNPPFWGGLQLDWNWMTSYGGWTLAHYGTADHWAPRTQILVAWRGFKARGYSFAPWPNTSRMCGL